MKIMVVQPAYPGNQAEVRQAVQFIYAALDTLSPGIDLVILPECANAPGVDDKDEVMALIGQTTPELLDKARTAARRTGATIAASILSRKPDGLHNHTLIIDGSGRTAANCEKAHLTLFERDNWGVTTPYLHGEHQPVFFEVAGVRCACVTCFDIYFPEYFSRLSASHVALIIHPSYQRGELSERIRTFSAARALDSGACLVHASYSMGEHAQTGGHSLAASADGTILHDAGQQVGCFTWTIHPEIRRTRPRSFGQPSVPVTQIIEESRLPWLYRPGGPMMVPPDVQMPYPRIISHRGFNTIAPENSLPAFAAALSLGAHEIELDVWPTRDGELLVCHDPTVDRTSDGKGEIGSLTRAAIEGLDAGSWFSPHFAGLPFAFLEDILRAFAGMAIFNIHVKAPAGAKTYDHAIMKKLIQTIDRHQCRSHAYIAGDQAVLEAARTVDPEITRCCLAGQDNFQITDLAIFYGCRKLQFFKPYVNHALISKAHEQDIKCNLFWSDEHGEARRFMEQGIDALLVNDLLRVMPLFKPWHKQVRNNCEHMNTDKDAVHL